MPYLFFVVLLSLFKSDPTVCSCFDPGDITQEQVDRHEAIFTGTVTSVTTVDYSYHIQIDVDKRYKGSCKKQITITTATSSAACGLNMQVGDRWLVFAYDNQGELSSDLCTRSAQIRKGSKNSRLRKDLRFLRAM